MKQAILWIECKARRSRFAGHALTVFITVSAIAEGRPPRFLVTSAQIMTAMQSRQLPTEGVEVKMPATITSSVAGPSLEIQSIVLLNARTAQIKMTCRNHADCLPFYVSASWPEESAVPAIQTSTLRAASSAQAGTVQEQQPSAKASGSKPDALKTEEPQAIHAGNTVMLLMDQNRVHIRVKVICLESGAAGDKVRVTTPDHKQAYVAEIVSPTLLKGSF
jgi:hypothetical protein